VSLSIQVRSDNGSVIVAQAGSADAAMLEPLRDPLTVALGDAEVLVFDLDELTGVDATGLWALIVEVLGTARGGRLRIAASHQAIGASLAEAHIDHLVAVHRSVADALGNDQDEVTQ
jgi:anti-anti-sigma regulatory factor